MTTKWNSLLQVVMNGNENLWRERDNLMRLIYHYYYFSYKVTYRFILINVLWLLQIHSHWPNWIVKCRMEILNLSSKSSIVKLIGTIVSISGAFVVIFYKGLPIIAFPSPNTPSLDVQLQTQPNWIVGGMFLSISCILVSFIYVTKVMIELFQFNRIILSLNL